MRKSGITTLLFDLDGTLVDSLLGIEASIRSAVEQHLPGRVLPDIRRFIGPPIKTILARLFPELSENLLEELAVAFRQHYDTVGCTQSRLFDGVAEILAKLDTKGVAMFVLTNKPLRPTLAILELTGIKDRFRAVVSPDSSDPPFPAKTAGASHLQRQCGLAADSTLLIGDGIDDAEAAAACGFGFVLASYGYGEAIGGNALIPRLG